MKFQAAARAIRGSKDTQEDAWRVYDAKGGDAGEIAASDAGVTLSGGGLLLVADGIGGHYGGDVASRITADVFVKTFFGNPGECDDRFTASLNAANQAVAAEQEKEPGLKDMGATLVAGHVHDGELCFVSIGDSLILRYRDDELHRVNADHSYMEIADREALGSGDPDRWRDVMTRKGRDSITIAVLGRGLEDFGHKPQIASRKILPGDLLIFSSDGLETLTMVQIHNFIRVLLPRGVGAVADGLIKAVDGIGKNRNYQDNATLIVALAEDAPAATRLTGGERESAKTAPVVSASAPAPVQPAPAAAAAAGPEPAKPVPVQSGSINEAAKSGRWSPAKLLLGIAIGLLGVAAVLFATGKFNMFRASQVKVEAPASAPAAAPASAPAAAPAPAPAAAPPPQERSLRPQPALTPDTDSPQRPSQGISPNQGGDLQQHQRHAAR
ncbi:MAG TPA: protein phosphatase 2C domain-containing protein [Xanthobacteraceae bacterium]|nr:protein phosphatase 2C domain-containing protein [Xanthobacteraceae bacterium]